MGGGLMQLVAYGAQDIYLTGNPQITFFKVVYRRHTNYAVESIQETFNGDVDFGKRVTATISREGDLIQQMYLEVVLPTLTVSSPTPANDSYWVYGIGNALIKQVEIEIGGQLIDRQYGDWMNIWTELSIPAGKRLGYDSMVGNFSENGKIINSNQMGNINVTQTYMITGGNGPRLFIPLQFWFNRNPGLALPLIALQYHEVKLNLEIRPLNELWNSEETGVTAIANGTLSTKLYVDYIYLDTDERRRFAQVSHEYLIEQVQFTGTENIDHSSKYKNIVLNFNHPVKEIIWAHTTNTHATVGNLSPNNNWFNYSGANQSQGDFGVGSSDSFYTALLQLNGHDRFTLRTADYFRKVQNYEHHTNIPRCDFDIDLDKTDTKYTRTDGLMQYIYSYSFAISPEEHQPSGTCNFSRIDNAVLQLDYTGVPAIVNGDNLNLNIYAVNYNVLRIMSGMGGLAFSN